jgi:hypothetical protein
VKKMSEKSPGRIGPGFFALRLSIMLQVGKNEGRRVSDRMPGNCLSHLGRVETAAVGPLQNPLPRRSADALFEK